MPTETAKRIRPRKGYVMVELTEAERAKLEKLAAKRSVKTGIRFKLAPMLRLLLAEAK